MFTTVAKNTLLSAVFGFCLLTWIGCGWNVDDARRGSAGGQTDGSLAAVGKPRNDSLAPAPPKNEEISEKHCLRGLELLQSGDPADVARDAQEAALALEAFPDNGQAYYVRGVTFLRQGFARIAVADFKRAIELGYETSDAYADRARASLKIGRIRVAMDDSVAAIQKDPNNAGAFFTLGLAHVYQEDLSAAERHLVKGLELDPSQAVVIAEEVYRSSVTLTGRERLTAAKWAFNKARELAPDRDFREPWREEESVSTTRNSTYRSGREKDEAKHREALKYYRRGRDMFDAGDFDGALTELTTAVKLDPKIAEAYVLRGTIHLRRGFVDTARLDFNQAISNKRELSTAYRLRGRTYYELGNMPMAILDFSKAIRIRPTDARSYWLRGIAYHKLEKYDAKKHLWAVADLKEAQRIQPDLASKIQETLRLVQKKDNSHRIAAPSQDDIRTATPARTFPVAR